jgi:hypothetical protein
MRRTLPFSALCLALAAAACQDALSVSIPSTPQNLGYQLEPSGGSAPLGILLFWDGVGDTDLASYRVYSRGSSSGSFGLRGETTSNTFHDNGVPHLDYYVTAVDLNGNESDASNVITVDQRLRLAYPASLSSISLDGAIHLEWTDNGYLSNTARFSLYRIYSADYDLDLGECGATWALEGTTVAPEFLVSAISNGVPQCFGVTAVSWEGYESLWSPVRQDTPRPDARNKLVYALQQNATQAGFRFWNDANNDGKGQSAELGLIGSGNAADIDFRVTRGAGDTLWIEPRYSGDSMQVYGQVDDVTSIDYAPEFGYTRNLYQAVPTYGYVFKMVDASGLHYGALRVTHVNRDYMIFDWSMQTDIGNPELIVGGGLPISLSTGFEVPGSR